MTIVAKYAGTCSKCGGDIQPGQQINWDKTTRRTEHEKCPEGMENAELVRYGSVPQHLGVGDIWGNDRHGVFVVVASQPARWSSEDRDVYGHVSTWYTIRPATTEEIALWVAAVEAGGKKSEQRKRLNAKRYVYSADTRSLEPTSEMTRMLDSYDDRWQPPTAIALSDEEARIEEAAIATRSALRVVS